MQYNNTNFETIITTWRRLSGELQSEPSFASMSGDSDRHSKKKEEATLLISDKSKPPATNVATAGAVAAEAALTETVASTSPNDKPEHFIQRDKGDSQDVAGDDTNENDYLENNVNESKPNFNTEDKATEWEKDKLGDKVDSVYLRPPPPHKARSSASTADEEEDCGIKCLYYTLQCCDCVLM